MISAKINVNVSNSIVKALLYYIFNFFGNRCSMANKGSPPVSIKITSDI